MEASYFAYFIVAFVIVLVIGWFVWLREEYKEPKEGDTYVDRSQNPHRLFVYHDEIWEDRGPIE
jgi:hypothetical protein